MPQPSISSQSVSPDAFYFHEGDAAASLYVLIQGRVKIIQTTPEGHQVVLRVIVPGRMFGGIAAFEDTVYPVSAQAITSSKSVNNTIMLNPMSKEAANQQSTTHASQN